jgi:prepilin-type N-terminal cleavage/methylation domain-containing protein
MQKHNKTHISKANTHGYTLIELVVAVTIFTMVSVGVLSSLLSVIDASRQQQAYNEAVDSLNFVVDDMMRRIRTGYNFHCGTGSDTDNGTCNSFSFTSSEVGESAFINPRVTYREVEGQLWRNIAGDDQQLTGHPLDITDLSFRVTGAGGGDFEQSRVLLSITGEIDDDISERTQSFRIQTTISQRLLFPPSE